MLGGLVPCKLPHRSLRFIRFHSVPLRHTLARSEGGTGTRAPFPRRGGAYYLTQKLSEKRKKKREKEGENLFIFPIKCFFFFKLKFFPQYDMAIFI